MDHLLLISFIVLLVVAIALIALAVVLLTRATSKRPNKGEADRAGRQMVDSFRSSISVLQSKVSDKDFLYRVPWILTLGEPHSGKTSLLRQLDAESSDRESDVEWFFLSHGAMLDVPGDFLIGNDGTSSTDGRWKKLLRLLVRHRPHRPIDGIVLTIPAPAMLGSSALTDAQRLLRATAIRSQLDQLQMELRMVVPIYIVITKCDLVRGFRDFCEQLDPASSDQLFGWSNASTLETSYSPDRVDEAFSSFALRLQELQLGIFARELHASVDDLFLFPGELERMRTPVTEYLTQIFRETSYVEANFLRGIYFCGDVCLKPQPVSGMPALSGSDTELALFLREPDTASTIHEHASLEPHQPHLAFVRHLLDLKVFPEAKIARPTRGIRLLRNRGLATTQIALAVFVVVFSIGTTLAYFRLSYFGQHHLQPALDVVASRFPQGAAERNNYSVSAAYDLVDLLGVVDVQGFRALFLPASWSDPVSARIGGTLADAFSRRVLIAFKNELTVRVKRAKSSCRPLPAASQKLPTDVDALAQRSFENDLEYQQLEQSLSEMDQLRKAVNTYNNLRLAGRGSFQDLNLLFGYLIHRSLDDENRFKNNPYYLRALQAGSAGPVELQNPLDHANDFEACMAVQTESRVNNFFKSWFGDNNPLAPLTNEVADEIDELTTGTGRTREKLRFLVDDVRRLDSSVSSGSYRWLREPSFDVVNFPVISKGVSAEPFADPAFLQRIDDNGSRAFSKLKDDLFSVKTGPTGYVLVDFQGEVKIDPEVNAAAASIDLLSTQDFMADAVAVRQLSPDHPVIWHKAELSRATQLVESYEKYLKENLPLIPTGLRTDIQTIAREGLRASALAAVADAQEPANQGLNAAALMSQIRSFDESLPVLTQIAASLGGSAPGASSDLDAIILGQATLLSRELTIGFKSQAFYKTSQSALAAWDGVRPLSLLRYGADTPDDLEVYIAKQREILKDFSLNYAMPLEQYLQSHRLQDVNGPDVWAATIQDVQDYEANKPGNALSSLETFIRSGMDKINLANSCQPSVTGPPSSNYFLAVRAKLQKAAVDQCGEILLDEYNTDIAQFFNQKLSGKFPFGHLPASDEMAEADPTDTLTFLAQMTRIGEPLMKYLQSSNSHADIQAFLRDSEGVRQLFAGGLADGQLLADSKFLFRVNPQAEINGDRIIEWKLQVGDATVKLGEAANGLRWTYGAPVILTLRFAKDSPDVPAAGDPSPGMRIEARTVTYEFRDPWALFHLLATYGNDKADYGAAETHSSGTLRFVIPTAVDAPHSKLQAAIKPQQETRVFSRLRFFIPGAKEPREVAIPTFPNAAPVVRGTQPDKSSN